MIAAALLPIVIAALTQLEAQRYAAAVRRDGFVLLPSILPLRSLDAIAAAFEPVLAARIAAAPSDRGPKRYYVAPPFAAPFSDPAIWNNADVMAVVRLLVGASPVMCQWAVDTPLNGSEFQKGAILFIYFTLLVTEYFSNLIILFNHFKFIAMLRHSSLTLTLSRQFRSWR